MAILPVIWHKLGRERHPLSHQWELFARLGLTVMQWFNSAHKCEASNRWRHFRSLQIPT
jgi:hypothetical protein